MAAVVRALAVGWLLVNAAAAVHQRFLAMETSPAVLSPRFYKAAPARPLQRRQSQCTSGSHPCNEIGQVGSTACCSDTQYCIVDPDDASKPACCPIGSTCGSPCNDQSFQCNVTSTSTVGAETTTVVQAACCPRVCTSTSQFGCPTSLGGGCCNYGAICGSSSQCLSTRTTSTSSSPLVTQVPSGCTTSQISCAQSLGGGCCAVTQSCTLVTGRAHCADAIITPTASGVSRAEDKEEMGAGAKAGIGVGVVCGSGLVIGAITWWCLRRRKVRRQSMSTHRPRPQGVIGAVLGAGRDTTDDNSEMVSHGGPGMTQDYFGPDPVIGPYSEFHSPSGGTTPGVDRDRGGVPLIPHGPGDIAVPVEIDSSTPKLPEEPASYSGSRVSIPPPAHPPIPPPSHNMTEGVFELYGSDFLSVNQGSANQGTPSPVTPLAPSPLDETPQSEAAGNQPRSPRHQ